MHLTPLGHLCAYTTVFWVGVAFAVTVIKALG